MIQFNKKLITKKKVTVSLDFGFTNNTYRNDYHLFYLASGDAYLSAFESTTSFGLNCAPSIEISFNPSLTLGADVNFTKQFVNKLRQPNVLSTSLYLTMYL